MKKFSWFVLATMIATMGTFVACSDNDDDQGNSSTPPIEGNTLMSVEGNLDLPQEVSEIYQECKIVSAESETDLADGNFQIDSYYNNTVQTFLVGDDDNNIYMLNRNPISRGQKVNMSVESTTIAMVTMHPLFASVDREDYASLVTIITASEYYKPFYNEVENCVINKKHLYDDNNNNLIIAFSNLIEDLCGGSEEEGNYDGSLDDVRSSTLNTRAVFKHSQINPEYIKAEIDGKVLSLRTVWSTPSYYGTVRLPNGNIQEKVIPACSDFGIMDLGKNNFSITGDPLKFTFSQQGDYLFNFSRKTTEATLDFYVRLVSTILSTMGLDIKGDEDAVVEAAKYVTNAMVAAGANMVGGSGLSVSDCLEIALDATLNYITTHGKLGKITFTEKFLKYTKYFAATLNWYNKFKGAANFGLRIKYAMDAPETLSFCLCFYNNEVTTCTEATLYEVSGNNQTGYANQKLLLPLTVRIETLGDDGQYHEASSYHRVKFEVVSGGGKVDFETVAADNENKASTYWTLGESGDQVVKATVVDVITGKEISEPVMFTANISTASVTIRLDWSKHSQNTDIDLHVVDPFGERIYFRHMRSASGGVLDRDDVVGPGPEHVRWTNAPSGTYKIYVHYYPNNATDRSVTTYKVSVNADGVTYKPKTGSISYDQMVGVGQFTIGESVRSVNIETVEDDQPFDTSTLPKK